MLSAEGDKASGEGQSAAPPVAAPLEPPPKAGAAKQPDGVKDLLDFD